MKNKRIKQSMVSVMVGHRKLFWFQDTTEIYASVSDRQLCLDMIEMIGDDAEEAIRDLEYGPVNSNYKSWKSWWKPCAYEEYTKKGCKYKIQDGYVILPLINGMNYSRINETVMVSTSYN